MVLNHDNSDREAAAKPDNSFASYLAKRFELFWWGKDPRWPGNVTLVLVAILAPPGFFRDVRKHVGPAELFLPCYLAVILPYFSPGFQLYLLPLYPLLVPRLLALLTEHPSTVYPIHLDRDPEPDEIWNYLMRVHASYVVVAHLDGLSLPRIRSSIEHWCCTRSKRFPFFECAFQDLSPHSRYSSTRWFTVA
jgi:hypothetical protein